MKTNTWTDEQANAIGVRNKNILVSAAAGSGKTTVLVERIKELIIDEHVSVDEILVATFTNAAAGDMKEKIIKAIKKSISEKSADRKFLKAQLNKVYKANIGTFHSFALEVIRRYFYIIDADPDFKICDDAEKTIMCEDAADELFEEKFKSSGEEFICFLKAYCGAKSEKKAKDMILSLYEAIQSLPEPFAWLSDRVERLNGTDEELYAQLEPFIMDDLKKNMEYVYSAFKKIYAILEDNGISSVAAKNAKDISMIGEILESAKAGNYDEAAGGIRGISYETFKAAKDESAVYNEVKDQIKVIRDKAKECIKEIRIRYFGSSFDENAVFIRGTYESAKTLLCLIRDFDALYREKKKEKMLLDFNDIEHFAIEILKNENVAGEYRRKFKYIFVDEYQDSNIIQETMIGAIMREDNVFMVGDVKQSIYKFRMAEPEIFISKYKEFKSARNEKNIKIDLNTNFRCKGSIVNAVNDICGEIMPYEEDSALRKGISYSGPLDYPVQLHIASTKEIDDEDIDVEINEIKKVELEAGVVTRLIKDTVGSEIHDEDKGVRLVELSDIVILMRSIKNYGDKYQHILTENGIPAFIDGTDGYFDTPEIEIFMNLLKVIDNKRQDVPLISVLYSKIMNFSADELALIRIQNRELSYYKAFEKYGQDGDDAQLRVKCLEAFERLDAWRSIAQTMPLDEFIWKLMWETGYYIYVSALAGGQQRQANLRALSDKSRAYMRKSTDGLYGFLKYAEILKQKGVKTGQVSLTSENENVVRIKTVHKSKGLEFPVVIVSGLGKRFMSGREKSDVSMHREIGIGLPFYDTKTGKQRKTLFQAVIESQNKRENMEEEGRILYVALTRAKDRLFLVGTAQDAEKEIKAYTIFDEVNWDITSCYMDALIPVFLKKKMQYKNHDRSDAFLQMAKSSNFKDELRAVLTGAKPNKQNAEVEKIIEEGLAYEYPDKKALSAKSKYAVSELGHGQARDIVENVPVIPLFVQGKDTLTRAEIGAAIHAVMEKMDFKESARLFEKNRQEGQRYLSGLVSDLKEKGIITNEAAEKIDIRRMEMFLKSDIGRRAAKAEKLYKETPFNLMKEIDGIETIIQGVIDCYFEEDGEYILVDYKSDYIAGEDDVERVKQNYVNQIALYSEALEVTKNRRVREKYLYLFGRDRAFLMP